MKQVERKVLRVGMECAYAPNNWEEDHVTDTNLPISNNEGFYAEGYDVQIAKQIGEGMDAEIEIVKYPREGLLEALNQGQTEAALSLGFTRWQTMRKVVFPQAVRNCLPVIGNELINNIKGISVLNVIGLQN